MTKQQCECVDPGCPKCGGQCEDKGTQLLTRIDFADEPQLYACFGCADDMLESGVFSVK